MIHIIREEMIEKLKSLAVYCEYKGKDDPDGTWTISGKALQEAIELLEHEVSEDGAADLIKRAIEKEGINQNILAELTGVTRQNVNQMLNRGKNCMRYDSFEKLAKALGYEVVLRKNSLFEK